MTIMHKTPVRLSIIALLVMLSFLPAVSARLFATEEATPIPDIPDAVVWVDAGTPGAHRLSITYSELIERSQAETHLNTLLSETGWIPLGVEISDGSVMESGEHPMTSVEIVVPEIVEMDSGALPLEPIVTALKDFPRLTILFMVPSGFVFQGLEDFENRYVDIRFQEGANTYQYTVRIKDPSFDKLDLPIFGPRATVPESDHESGRGVLVITLAVILALSAAVLVYLITSRVTGRGARNRDQRS